MDSDRERSLWLCLLCAGNDLIGEGLVGPRHLRDFVEHLPRWIRALGASAQGPLTLLLAPSGDRDQLLWEVALPEGSLALDSDPAVPPTPSQQQAWRAALEAATPANVRRAVQRPETPIPPGVTGQWFRLRSPEVNEAMGADDDYQHAHWYWAPSAREAVLAWWCEAPLALTTLSMTQVGVPLRMTLCACMEPHVAWLADVTQLPAVHSAHSLEWHVDAPRGVDLVYVQMDRPDYASVTLQFQPPVEDPVQVAESVRVMLQALGRLPEHDTGEHPVRVRGRRVHTLVWSLMLQAHAMFHVRLHEKLVQGVGESGADVTPWPCDYRTPPELPWLDEPRERDASRRSRWEDEL